jgi:hypothetical protein
MASLSAQAGIPSAAADEQDAEMHDAVAVVATTAPVAASAAGGVGVGSAAGKEAAHAAADGPLKIAGGLQYAAVSQQQQLAALMAADAEQTHALGDEQHQDHEQEQAEVSALVGGNSAVLLCCIHIPPDGHTRPYMLCIGVLLEHSL